MVGLPVLNEKEKTRKQLYTEQVEKRIEGRSQQEDLENATDHIRILRTLELVEKYLQVAGQTLADLGCGRGVLSQQFFDRKAHVTGVDVLEQPPANFSGCLGINYRKACLPYVPLPDDHFDGVIFTDVIAEIEEHLRRLTLSELSRLLKREGWLLCSTQLDLYSLDPCDQLIHLMKTEFEIISSKKSFHRLHFYLARWMSAPSRYIRAANEPHYRLAQLNKRGGFLRFWFTLNSYRGIARLWRAIAFLIAPCHYFVRTNIKFLLACERISQIIWGEAALTHVIVLARKKKI